MSNKMVFKFALLVLDLIENEYNLDLKNIGFFKGKSRGK